MAQDLESAQARLANIQTVFPILSALRTISLGSWQIALNRRGDLKRYSVRLLGLLPIVLPHLPSATTGERWLAAACATRAALSYGALGMCNPWITPPLCAAGDAAQSTSAVSQVRRGAVLVIGSERGLCGRYNAAVLAQAERHLATLAAVDVEVLAFGKRIIAGLERQGVTLHEKRQMPITALPSFDIAFDLVSRWMQRYEVYDLDAVDIVYNAYVNAGVYTPTVYRLLPPALPPAEDTEIDPASVIVETDPTHLYARIVEQWSALSLYDVLLEAAASEHAARFRLMESATQNTEDLMEDLTQVIQSARRQAITREMQELAAGAEVVGG